MELKELLIAAQAKMMDCIYMGEKERNEVEELINNLKRTMKIINNSERRINSLMEEVIELKKKLNEKQK